jgi:hypothetical protein
MLPSSGVTCFRAFGLKLGLSPSYSMCFRYVRNTLSQAHSFCRTDVLYASLLLTLSHFLFYVHVRKVCDVDCQLLIVSNMKSTYFRLVPNFAFFSLRHCFQKLPLDDLNVKLLMSCVGNCVLLCQLNVRRIVFLR